MTYNNKSVTQTVDTKLIDRLIEQSKTTEDDLNRGRTGNIDASVLESLLAEKERKSPQPKPSPPPEALSSEAAFMAELEESIFSSSEDNFSGALFSPSQDEVAFFSEPSEAPNTNPKDDHLSQPEIALVEEQVSIEKQVPAKALAPLVEAPAPPVTPLPSPPVTGEHSAHVATRTKEAPAPIRKARPRPPRKAVLKPARARQNSSAEVVSPPGPKPQTRPTQRRTPIPSAFSESTPLPRVITQENEVPKEARTLPPEVSAPQPKAIQARTLPPEVAAPGVVPPKVQPQKVVQQAPAPLEQPEESQETKPEENQARLLKETHETVQEESEETGKKSKMLILALVALFVLGGLGLASYLLLSGGP